VQPNASRRTLTGRLAGVGVVLGTSSVDVLVVGVDVGSVAVGGAGGTGADGGDASEGVVIVMWWLVSGLGKGRGGRGRRLEI